MGFRACEPGFVQRFVCVVLAVVTASSPSTNLLAQTRSTVTPASQTAPSAAPTGLDTTYVTRDAVAMVVLRPAQLMKSTMGQLLPVEVATAAGIKYLGIDPADVEEAIGFVDSSNPTVPNYGLTLKFSKPQTGIKLPQELRQHTQPDKLNGKTYLKSQQAELPSFYAADKSTLVIAPDATLRQLVEKPEKDKRSPLIDRVHKIAAGSDLYATVDLAMLRPLIQMGLASAPIPPEAKPFADSAGLLSAIELTVNLSKTAPTELVVHANDAAAAGQVEGLLGQAVAQAREKMRADLAPQMASEDPVERSFAQYMERVSGQWSQPLMPKRDGAKLTIFRVEGSTSPQQQLTMVAIVGVMVALLLPATQAAREAARRNQSLNNLKQISLGFQNFHDTRKAFPANAIYSKDGKPLLSWRVQILPFIEEQALYNKFHLDEPWDSEHNRALLAEMPQVFANPNLPLAGKTNYLAIVGKECVIDGTEKGSQIGDVKDGTSKTIAVVEADANKAIEWTKPEDLRFDANNPTQGVGHLRPGAWLAAFVDGHIEAISTACDPNLVKAMMTKAGGETVQLP